MLAAGMVFAARTEILDLAKTGVDLVVDDDHQENSAEKPDLSVTENSDAAADGEETLTDAGANSTDETGADRKYMDADSEISADGSGEQEFIELPSSYDLRERRAIRVSDQCGTTPEYIAELAGKLDLTQYPQAKKDTEPEKQQAPKEDRSFYHTKEAEGRNRKLIAVELAPPMGIDDEKLMDAAHLLQKSGVDVLTFPDSPSGRTRADSILMAEKVARETGMCVMPHICCRDKNAIAMRSQLLGAYINGIQNFLVITGDPIPSMVRTTVKSVFNFDSVGLMQILADMNEEQFTQAPASYGGAINQGRRNLEVEIGRVKKKMAAGATFFLTQPISTQESADRVRRIKEETGARILCGIMPFVSLKNATFMKNEMAGIDVTDEVLARYRADMTREEGEQAGVQLAKEVIVMTEDFADGYYFSFPFNRVAMLEKILN